MKDFFIWFAINPLSHSLRQKGAQFLCYVVCDKLTELSHTNYAASGGQLAVCILCARLILTKMISLTLGLTVQDGFFSRRVDSPGKNQHTPVML